MASFILWDDTTDREVQWVDTFHAEDLWTPAEGRRWVPIAGDGALRTLSRVNGALVEVDRQPAPNIALALAQNARWAEAQTYRDSKQQTFMRSSTGYVVQTDDKSQGRIASMALAASLKKAAGQPWNVNWTMADNSVVPLDADQMIALGFEVSAFVAACQDAGTAIRAQIQAAATVEAVAAVNIRAGYPA